MTTRTDFTDVPPPLHRQAVVWRSLVTFQLLVVLAILGALVAIAVAGTGSIFASSGV